MSRLLTILAMLLGMLALPALASGQATKGPPSAADRETARSLVGLGHKKTAAGDLKGALQAYKQADAIMGVPTTGALVAKGYERLGQLLDAHDALVKVTLFPKKPNEPPAFAGARDAARAKIQQLRPRIPSLKVELNTTKGPLPAGVEPVIHIDGVKLAGMLAAVPRKVNPGKHTISGSAPGWRAELEVTVKERENRVVKLVLKPHKDDKPNGDKPNGDKPNGDKPNGNGDKVESGAPVLAIVGFVIGGVGVAAGAITGGLAMSAGSAAKEGCNGNVCPTANQDDADHATLMAHISTAGFAVGGAGVVLGVIGLLLPDAEPSSPAKKKDAQLQPWLGLGTIGLSGTF